MPKKNDEQKKKSAQQKRWDIYYENEKQRMTGEHLTGRNNPILAALRDAGDTAKRKKRDDRQIRDFYGGNKDATSSIARMSPEDQSSIRSAHSAIHMDFSDAKRERDSAADDRRRTARERLKRDVADAVLGKRKGK